MAAGIFQADLGHGFAEQLAVLGLFNDLFLGGNHFHAEFRQGAVLGQGQGGVERGLPAHGGQQGVRALLFNDFGDNLRGDWLDVGGVGNLRVGHNGGRVGVYQDDAITLVLKRLARLSAGVVEFAGLADDDGTGTDNQNALDIRTLWHVSPPFVRFPSAERGKPCVLHRRIALAVYRQWRPISIGMRRATPRASRTQLALTYH